MNLGAVTEVTVVEPVRDIITTNTTNDPEQPSAIHVFPPDGVGGFRRVALCGSTISHRCAPGPHGGYWGVWRYMTHCPGCGTPICDVCKLHMEVLGT